MVTMGTAPTWFIASMFQLTSFLQKKQRPELAESGVGHDGGADMDLRDQQYGTWTNGHSSAAIFTCRSDLHLVVSVSGRIT
jgi:hypothetical protein